MNIFERAARTKLRFHSTKGNLTTEDLFDLSLTSLDSLARSINSLLKAEGEESFIETKPEKNTVLELQLDILKHVIATKITALEAAKKGAETKAQIDTIKQLLVEKKSEALKSMSTEELEVKLAGLSA